MGFKLDKLKKTDAWRVSLWWEPPERNTVMVKELNPGYRPEMPGDTYSPRDLDTSQKGWECFCLSAYKEIYINK